MRLLLINPEQTTDLSAFHPPSVTEVSGTFPPLGLAYIASAVKSSGHEVEIFDMQMNGNSSKELFELISKNPPDIIGLGSMTFTFKNAVKIAESIKEEFKDIPIIFGGSQSSAFPIESLKRDCFDLGVTGEGEETIVEILESYSRSGSLPTKINGTVVRNNEEIRSNPPREWIKDLDGIPFPARELIENRLIK